MPTIFNFKILIKLIIVSFIFPFLIQAKTFEQCFIDAAKENQVPLDLLLAVAFTESSFHPDSLNTNKNGSTDYGFMQINSLWQEEVKSYGYSWQQVTKDPCSNIMFGSIILKQNHKRLGNWTKAIGAYNAGFSKKQTAKIKREKYYKKVINNKLISKKYLSRLRKKSYQYSASL